MGVLHFQYSPFRKTIKSQLLAVAQEESAPDGPEKSMYLRRARYGLGFLAVSVFQFPDAVQNVRRVGIGKIAGESAGIVPINHQIRKKYARDAQRIFPVGEEGNKFCGRESRYDQG